VLRSLAGDRVRDHQQILGRQDGPGRLCDDYVYCGVGIIMIFKRLSCSVTGKVEGKIEFATAEIADAIKAACESRDQMGLQISYIEFEKTFYDKFTIKMTKTDTPEHFKCLADQAKKMGWE
jgi:hypothetical protein